MMQTNQSYANIFQHGTRCSPRVCPNPSATPLRVSPSARATPSSGTGKAYANITYEGHQRAKAVVYDMLFGQSAASLAGELNIRLHEAQHFTAQFKRYLESVSCLTEIEVATISNYDCL